MKALFVGLLAVAACARSTPPPPAQASAKPVAPPCAPTGKTLGLGELAIGPLMKGGEKCAQLISESTLRRDLVRQMTATGCFARVVDLAVEQVPVDLTMTASFARLEACTYSPQTAVSEQGRDAAKFNIFQGGAMGGAFEAAARAPGSGGWSEAQLLDVAIRSGEQPIWRKGVVTVALREGGMVESTLQPDEMLARTMTAVSRDLARKITRVVSGDSPYGLITLTESGPAKKPQIAIITGEGPDDDAARATIAVELAPQLGPGYPLFWPPDRFNATREAPTRTTAVVGLFASMEDATDWILTRQPLVKGLRILPVR